MITFVENKRERNSEQDGNFLEGVFNTKKEADDYIKEVNPNEPRQIVETCMTNYPIYVVEDYQKSFKYFEGADAVIQYFKALERDLSLPRCESGKRILPASIIWMVDASKNSVYGTPYEHEHLYTTWYFHTLLSNKFDFNEMYGKKPKLKQVRKLIAKSDIQDEPEKNWVIRYDTGFGVALVVGTDAVGKLSYNKLIRRGKCPAHASVYLQDNERFIGYLNITGKVPSKADDIQEYMKSFVSPSFTQEIKEKIFKAVTSFSECRTDLTRWKCLQYAWKAQDEDRRDQAGISDTLWDYVKMLIWQIRHVIIRFFKK